MGRIVVLTILVLIVFWKIDARPQPTKPGCWYEGKRHQEGQVVNTTEPCLRCRCNEGSLRCRLRICPKLPSPAPSGCTMRTPRDNSCCAELVCDHLHEKNVTVKRDPSKDTRRQEDGCIHDGVRYGPGSAMMGSRRCEYCYCISGNRRCLRPRCLFPLAGCIPLYASYSCCPVAYNCNNSAHHWYTSLGSSPSRNGCRVGDRSYKEGEMVRDTGLKGTCDNCFCAMGGVRCVPLSCAPPLQGCTPIVREGQCCPSTYNCSGTIEVKATQNYASYAFISKDYAKFRKETNFFSINNHEVYQTLENSTVEGRGHKNSEKSSTLKTLLDTTTTVPSIPRDSGTPKSSGLSSTTSGTKRPTTMMDTTTEKMTSISSPEAETMDNEIPFEKLNTGKFSMQQETTFSMDPTDSETTEIPTTLESITGLEDSSLRTTWTSEESSEITNSIISREDFSETTIVPSEISTNQPGDETTIEFLTNDSYTTQAYEENQTTPLPQYQDGEKATESIGIEKKISTPPRRVIESTTKFLKINESKMDNPEVKKNSQAAFGIGESAVISIKGPATASPTTILMPDNMLVINVTLRTNVSVGHVQGVTMNPVRSIPPDIEAILNITNRKKVEDYDYDYSQPTLPPSLPNVRIIPFVAADALVKQSEEIPSQVTNYPLGSVGLSPQELGPTVTSGAAENFYDIVTQKNRFIPPVETEGGFVPREPSYFDPPYRSTDHNLESHTGVSIVPADITNPHRKNDELSGICVFENRNYRHGDLLPSSGHCIICICYYGEVACSDEKCPPVKIGCSRLKNDKICCGKIICVDPEESPTVVLDRADAIAPVSREPLPSLDGMASPDPFRDVIKTKPAPDLPSLIEDMIPYLVEHRITKLPTSPTTPMTITNLETGISGQLVHQPDHQFVHEKSDVQLHAGMTDAAETSQVDNRTSSKQKTETLDPLEVTTNQNRPINDTQTVTGAMKPDQKDPNEPSIFSFGNVFDLLFSDNIDDLVDTETVGGLDKTTAKTPAGTTSRSSADPAFDPNSFGFSTEPPTIEPTEIGLNGAPEDRAKLKNHSKLVQKIPGITTNGPFGSSVDPASGQLQQWTKPQKDQAFDHAVESSTFIPTKSTSISSPGKTSGVSSEESWGTTTKAPETENNPMTTVSRGSTAGSYDTEVVTSAGGLLKLAGCNIYGRMYRVGRIITELSSPCLECRCTEVGVQCKQLEC